jgi:hypothetical protein
MAPLVVIRRPRGTGPDWRQRLRIYEGSPRQNFEEVFRAIGAVLDERGYREVLLNEVPDGFIVQGLRLDRIEGNTWSEAIGHLAKETLTFADDEIARYMDEALGRRGKGARGSTPNAHYYEQALRVIGRYLDDQHPRDVLFFEQEGGFVVRMLMSDQSGSRHALTEFTRDDIADLIARAPGRRGGPREPTTPLSP